jgi:cytoskeletal protein CcmA (bactofilin family)
VWVVIPHQGVGHRTAAKKVSEGRFLTMTEFNGEFPTVLGPDAKFKGELTFEKGLRILGQFEGQIKSKGALHVAEGAHIKAQIEAANVRVDGEIKGNVVCTERMHLTSTSRIEGDLRAARLEMNDGAQFVGNVTIGQQALEAAAPRQTAPASAGVRPTEASETPAPPRMRPAPPTPPAPPMHPPAPLTVPGLTPGR